MIVVHSSSDPFLDWDALQRATRLRRLVRIDWRRGVASLEDDTERTLARGLPARRFVLDSSFV
jgi:hypothetical protein